MFKLATLRTIIAGKSNLLIFVLVLVATFITRIPFLNAGYGNDPDSWRVAYVARQIAITGRYTASRLPGYPVQEIVSSLIWQGGPIALNAATALFSATAVAFFALAACKAGCKHYVLASATLAFVPVVYIASTTTIDYMWALAFTMGALYFAISHKPLISGAFLGIAIGCRITSALMLIPFGFLLAQTPTNTKENGRNIVGFVKVASVVGGIALLPPLLTYGSDFLHFYDAGRRTFLDIAKVVTVGIWGRVGIIGISIGFISLIIRKPFPKLQNVIRGFLSNRLSIASLIILFLFGTVFLRLPYEPGYLIPVIPFLILLLSKSLERPAFIFVCGAIITSSFVSINTSGITIGPIIADYESRIVWMEFTEYVSSLEEELPAKSIVVAGDWLPKFQSRFQLQSRSKKTAQWVFMLSEEEALSYLDDGYRIYYLPGQRLFAGISSASEERVLPLVMDGVDEAYQFMISGVYSR